jgi:hypothetical protein
VGFEIFLAVEPEEDENKEGAVELGAGTFDDDMEGSGGVTREGEEEVIITTPVPALSGTAAAEPVDDDAVGVSDVPVLAADDETACKKLIAFFCVLTPSFSEVSPVLLVLLPDLLARVVSPASFKAPPLPAVDVVVLAVVEEDCIFPHAVLPGADGRISAGEVDIATMEELDVDDDDVVVVVVVVVIVVVAGDERTDDDDDDDDDTAVPVD